MRHEDEGFSGGTMLLSFLLGGFVGAGVALLLAPKSGRETRQRIMDLTEDARDFAEDYTEQIKGRVTSSVGKGKEYYKEKKSIITAAVEAGKEAYEKEKERLSKEPDA